MDIFSFDCVHSTLDTAAQYVDRHTLPFAVTASQQTAGRGRFGRVWQAKPGNILLTVAWPDFTNPPTRPQISFCAALAVHSALSACCVPEGGTNPFTVRWTNDVLLSGKKISGILIEIQRDALLIGIGINVAWAPEGSLSLCQAGYNDISVDTLQEAVLYHLKSQLKRAQQQGFAAARREMLAFCHDLGQILCFYKGSAPLRGRMVGLDVYGRLLLETSTGIAALASDYSRHPGLFGSRPEGATG